ncbi:MAG TPA: O-antigen ligase family protein [Candidatus Saccharimonadales bacterium]|nr:O-antigen ligase family protein [Candidatus Saccharimonadales bacterium]
MKPIISLKPSRVLNLIVAAVLVWVPFAAFFTTWLASGIGHYTILRGLEDVVVVVGALVATVILFQKPRLWEKLRNQQVTWLVVAYTVLEITLGLVALARHDVNAKALGYGLLVNLRFLGFFIVCLVAASQSSWLVKKWKALVLIPASVVIAFGLVEHFVLSYDFLSHFGYSLKTIAPYETVNSSINYVRIFSTLRGSDPFGAYLVLIISLVLVLILKSKVLKQRLIYGLLLLGALIDLFYSYSRSAWIGAALSVALLLIGHNIVNRRGRRILGLALVVILIAVSSSFFVLRNNLTFQTDILHTNSDSLIPTSSNQGHLTALKSGLKDIVHQPLGRGPGTAGPASVYNLAPPRIAEDYFIQIGQEVGWIGIVLFILINWLVAKGLYLYKFDYLALGLLSALIGITFINLVSHAWTDNTLSYLWWGLAGIALSPVLSSLKAKTRAPK